MSTYPGSRVPPPYLSWKGRTPPVVRDFALRDWRGGDSGFREILLVASECGQRNERRNLAFLEPNPRPFLMLDFGLLSLLN